MYSCMCACVCILSIINNFIENLFAINKITQVNREESLLVCVSVSVCTCVLREHEINEFVQFIIYYACSKK